LDIEPPYNGSSGLRLSNAERGYVVVRRGLRAREQ
jgi:hypothetical protein